MTTRALVLAAVLGLTGGTASAAAARSDLEVAKNWLLAAARDTAAFQSATGLPFTYRTTKRSKACERAVRDRTAVSKWATCFRKDQKLLVAEVSAGAELRAASAKDAEPKGLRAIAEKITGDGRWLFAYINGDGITFTFLFRVTGDGYAARVTAIVVEEEVESG
jgi:hypothetical protein